MARDLGVIESPLMRNLLLVAIALLAFSGFMDLTLWLQHRFMVPGFVVSVFCFAETLLILAIQWLIGRLKTHGNSFGQRRSG